ncbi:MULTISPECIES: dihydrofolate reductase family protein [unclassified Fusibacter]|uniref:dihydrofolate reductase family protein n=1 Tax=unclassified Fusibacter TaxID=2624464 RepID=UPI0010111278|nr:MULTISPECIES: dihydrofolate reductase family protein [unclassified Fusibacter]MCK8060337.1 dihydrofolate reductase family protein [Fusibacter sp. A2]NPE20374.1 dihydrofolate reductase [Fusibacter sp. A1]RXV63580.1 dihydrofolate reductase [Fusibacter sp. A1]
MSNKRKLILFIATSLDGYIATEKDSLEWLFKIEGEGDNGYSEFYNTVDTILMGRRTYDWIMDMEKGNFPYKNKKCYVFSKSTCEKNEHVEFINSDIVEFTNRIKESEGQNIWIVGGGNLLQFFIKERLVDEFIITIAPTIIGRGIPLFKEFDFETELKLKGMRQFNQFAELHYELKKTND